jgi:hypothetical protein
VFARFLEKSQIFAKFNFENIKGIYLQGSGSQFFLLLDYGSHLKITAAIGVPYSILHTAK